MGFLSIEACKPILAVTQNKIMKICVLYFHLLQEWYLFQESAENNVITKTDHSWSNYINRSIMWQVQVDIKQLRTPLGVSECVFYVTDLVMGQAVQFESHKKVVKVSFRKTCCCLWITIPWTVSTLSEWVFIMCVELADGLNPHTHVMLGLYLLSGPIR